LVELHDGSVRVESKLGEGSCFHILLPVSEKVVAEIEAEIK